MKILMILGSYRRNGNTARVLALVERQLRRIAAESDRTIEIDTLYLGRQNLSACRGCRICFDHGEQNCPLNDDLLQIKAKMMASDGLVVATPVYVNDVSGTIKVWMDRLAHVNHRPAFAGKCAYLLATSGNGPTSHALKTLKMALSQWGFRVAGQTGFRMGALMPKNEARKLYQQRCERAADTLFRAINERDYARPSFLSLVTFKIQQNYWRRRKSNPALIESIDYGYWETKGWNDPNCSFYVNHETGRLTIILARITGTILARYVT